jgi:hypothetical protein
MTKREGRANARITRLGPARRQQQYSALLRKRVITATSCRRQLNPDQQSGARK